MPVPAGTSIGPYQVVEMLGRGGMGEVYRARDASLGRDVALKILPAQFASDADRMARFRREAQVLAALNHPNVAAIYDFRDVGGTMALVLELVEGPTLDDRIRSGRLDVEEALGIARQIAEGLEAAHEVGIVHRDLKPANVKLRPDGTVKVLDFGLAKPMEASGSSPGDIAVSPTITSPALTEHGVILGTAAYMSPEQAKGRPADRRSDVWGLGAMLFEMLSGRGPFRGEDVSDTLAAILRGEPPWDALPPDTPPDVQRLLRRCLQKDPRRRWQHVGDLRWELAELEKRVGEAPATVTGRRGRWPGVAMAGAAVLFAAVGAAADRWLVSPPAAEATPVAFTLQIPDGDRLAETIRPFGISRDGRQIAYAAVREGRQRLFVRSLDRPEAVAIAGTDNATYPVFSPDGASLAFWADGWIKRVPIGGGASTSIAAAQAPRGLAWAPDDRIVFTPASSDETGLWTVAAAGGSPTPLTDIDAPAEGNHRWPVVLPDGSGVLFAVVRRSRTDWTMEGFSFASGARHLVRENAIPVQVLDSGHLVYFASNGDLFAAPFDGSRMALTGPPVPLPERPSYANVPGNTSPAIAPVGTIVSTAFGEPPQALVIVGADAQRQSLDLPLRNYIPRVHVSPSGRRVAVVLQTGLSEWDIWIMDASDAATFRRLTVNGFSIWPMWESDQTLTYSAYEGRTWKILSRSVETSLPPRELMTGLPAEPIVLGRLPDGALVYTLNYPQQQLYVAAETAPPRMQTLPDSGPFNRALHGLSPDGRWVAYTSEQSGVSEVYITAMADGMTRPVSTGGGSAPVWTRDGRRLLYLRPSASGRAEVVSVVVSPDGLPGPATIAATGLAPPQRRDGPGAISTHLRGAFDLLANGSLLTIEERPTPQPSLDVVLHWPVLRGLTAPGR